MSPSESVLTYNQDSRNCSYANMGMAIGDHHQQHAAAAAADTRRQGSKTRSAENVTVAARVLAPSRQSEMIKQTSLPKPPSTGYFSDDDVDLAPYKIPYG